MSEDMLEDRVLIIDDEPANVEALRDYFDRCGMGYDFSDSLADAAGIIYEAHERGRPYSLVISDNHFKEDVGGFSNFNGIDLINILRGADIDADHQAFADDHFGRRYAAIVDHYSDKVLMFSGSAHSEPGTEGIPIAQKFPDEDGVCCEGGVISLMEEMGFRFSESLSSIKEYKRANGLALGAAGDVGYDADHEASVRAFLEEHLSPTEAAQYFE